MPKVLLSKKIRHRKIYKRLPLVLSVICLMTYSSLVFSRTFPDSQLKAGTSKINISPVNLQNARTLHDSLYARSLTQQVQDTRIAFIALDLNPDALVAVRGNTRAR